MENLLYALPLLACPVGMGLMMWLMMRGNKHQEMGSIQAPAESGPAGQSAAATSQDERLVQLRAQLEEVRAEQGAIAERIGRLSAEDQPAQPREAARAEPVEPASRRPTAPADGVGRSRR